MKAVSRTWDFDDCLAVGRNDGSGLSRSLIKSFAVIGKKKHQHASAEK